MLWNGGGLFWLDYYIRIYLYPKQYRFHKYKTIFVMYGVYWKDMQTNTQVSWEVAKNMKISYKPLTHTKKVKWL